VIVVDASAMLEFLLQTALAPGSKRACFAIGTNFMPHLIDVEVLQALRRLVRMGELSHGRAEEVVAHLSHLDLHRHVHLDLLARAWKLRDNVSAYDAVYIALSEATAAAIVTCDAPLAKAPGHRVRIELIA
jgi:predicted nucleic acid-binding protein